MPRARSVSDSGIVRPLRPRSATWSSPDGSRFIDGLLDRIQGRRKEIGPSMRESLRVSAAVSCLPPQSCRPRGRLVGDSVRRRGSALNASPGARLLLARAPTPLVRSLSAHPARTFSFEGAGAGAMLDACRLAGLSALEGYYAGVRARAQFGPTRAGFAGAGAGVGESREPVRCEGPRRDSSPRHATPPANMA